MMRPVTLITGASSGIGEAIAYLLAEAGEELVLVARGSERLSEVAAAIQHKTGKSPHILSMDLEEAESGLRLRAQIEAGGGLVRHLINSAGFGLLGDVAALSAAEQCRMIDLNCRAVVDLTATFLPDILAQKGGVLNLGSVAGFTPGPGFATYYASKAFVISFTRALRAELRGTGVTISALCPGPTATGFGPRSGVLRPWAGALLRSIDAASVARIGLAGYRAGKSIIVPGFKNRAMVALFHILPVHWVLPFVAAAQRKRRL